MKSGDGAHTGSTRVDGTLSTAPFSNLVVCSLERWDEVWRRNQLFVTELLHLVPSLRVLFVEPAVDVPYEFLHRRWPRGTGLRQLRPDGRLWALRPMKLVPRVVAPDVTDSHLASAVRATVAELAMDRPVLWVNDASYVTLACSVDWPTVYDATDDWTVAHAPPRILARRKADEQRLLERAEEVVVVSAALEASRGANRRVHRIPDGVDAAHFRRRRPRPADLPAGMTAVYVGTLHEDRLDIDLCAATARAIAPATMVFVGPNCLTDRNTERLRASGCQIIGARPYQDVPGYYQHADVIVVPHRVTPFTESLDPIKGYECLAVGRPTVSTAVAGMRDLGLPVEVATADVFPGRVRTMLEERQPSRPGNPPTWAQLAEQFLKVLAAAARKRQPTTSRLAAPHHLR